MAITKQQYNVAICAARENAMKLARASMLDLRETRVLVLRAVAKRQLELISEAADICEAGTEQDVCALEAMLRRLEDLVFDFHRKV